MAAISIIDAMDDPALFQPWFRGDSWAGWRTILKGVYGLPMDEAEAAFFRAVAERDVPSKPVKEVWIVAGRRAGKDSVASVIAAHSASLFSHGDRLRPGERAAVMCLATDRDQARIVLNYTKAFFTDIEMLKAMVQRETATGFELDNGVDVTISTNSFRAVRGRPILCAILDETAFWRDETSATPDEETYKALKPALASLPGSIIIGISSPYRKSGLLFRKFKDHYGKDGDVLVIKAPTLLLNPTIDPAIIAEAMAEDPAAASAEWMAEFRDDIAAFIGRDAIDAVTSPGVLERSPIAEVSYVAFVDPSGGASDSMTLAIAHAEVDKVTKRSIAMLDAVREVRAPFSPEAAVGEMSLLMKSYRVSTVTGDRYAGEWPREAFRKQGIEYRTSDLSKSDLYRELLPKINAGDVDLLDNKRLTTQLCSLERRTARGGRDSIDHPPGSHDDLANAVAGVLVQVSRRRAVDQPYIALPISIPKHGYEIREYQPYYTESF